MEPSNALPLYEYQALNGPGFIRILLLHPSNDLKKPLTCDIIQKDRMDILKDPHQEIHYEAVSYAWGQNPVFDKQLTYGNVSQLAITENVDLMLRHLRSATKLRHLWIDAICLNQDDGSEKGVQIPLMGEIFQQAKKVHIWLGEGGEKIPHVFAFFRTLVGPGEDQTIPVLPTTSISPIVVEDFLRRPWFTRRWVMQEVAMSQTAVVHCGEIKIAWPWLAAGMAKLWKRKDDVLRLEESALNALENVDALRKGQSGILSLLWRFSTTQCREPKDRCFALYGLASDLEYTGINEQLTDYTLPWQEVYTHVTKLFLQKHPPPHHEHLGSELIQHLFAFRSIWEHNKSNKSMPSW